MADHVHITSTLGGDVPPITNTPRASRRALAGGGLLALLGGFAAAKAASLPGGIAADLAENPDAELIRLCAEVGIHRDRFNNESELDSDVCPDWAAYIAAADAISEAEPQTLAGMVAKAHAAKGEAQMPDGSEDPAGNMAERWAWDLVNDIIRLGGRA